MSKVALNLVDQKFGRLTAMHRQLGEYKRWHWVCKCDCGKDREIL